MHGSRFRKIGGSVVASALLLSSACGHRPDAPAETRHEATSIDLDKIDSARVELRMGGGELRVKSGTPKLVQASYAFNVPEWAPVVSYHPNGTVGELTISQPDTASGLFRNSVYTWDLSLNDQVQTDLTASMGGGEANLELGRMNLRSVRINMGAGELKVDLRGEPKHDYDVRIQGGVGEATVYLPKQAGIEARAVGGIGTISVNGLEQRDGVWINPDGASASATIHLDVKGGVGEIHLIR